MRGGHLYYVKLLIYLKITVTIVSYNFFCRDKKIVLKCIELKMLNPLAHIHYTANKF